MAKCNNCQTALGCSCQQRKATDGTVVCNNCLVSYENKLVDKMNSANRTIKK
jgi:hypothetical protein